MTVLRADVAARRPHLDALDAGVAGELGRRPDAKGSADCLGHRTNRRRRRTSAARHTGLLANTTVTLG
jgi:hypothetical protein